jgi:hypothetical protein
MTNPGNTPGDEQQLSEEVVERRERIREQKGQERLRQRGGR